MKNEYFMGGKTWQDQLSRFNNHPPVESHHEPSKLMREDPCEGFHIRNSILRHVVGMPSSFFYVPFIVYTWLVCCFSDTCFTRKRNIHTEKTHTTSTGASSHLRVLQKSHHLFIQMVPSEKRASLLLHSYANIQIWIQRVTYTVSLNDLLFCVDSSALHMQCTTLFAFAHSFFLLLSYSNFALRVIIGTSASDTEQNLHNREKHTHDTSAPQVSSILETLRVKHYSVSKSKHSVCRQTSTNEEKENPLLKHHQPAGIIFIL